MGLLQVRPGLGPVLGLLQARSGLGPVLGPLQARPLCKGRSRGRPVGVNDWRQRNKERVPDYKKRVNTVPVIDLKEYKWL